MPRKKSESNTEPQTETPATEKALKAPAISESELASLATLGPSFEAGVNKVREQVAAADAAKAAAKAAAKLPKATLRKLRAAAQKVLEAVA